MQRARVLIVGSGISGIGVAAVLRQAGVPGLRMITAHSDFGGVWHQNVYPGCAADQPSPVYQFDFALADDWKRLFATQGELADYLRRVAADHELYEATDFEVELLAAEWLDDEVCWSVSTTAGTYHAEVLVLATGSLQEPVVPSIPGAASFQGRLFHASRWPRDYTGAGDRIAVVGSGASAMQIVPALEGVAASVTAFQRTPRHVLPKRDHCFSAEELAAFREHPETYEQLRAKLWAENEQAWNKVRLGTLTDEELQAFDDLALKFLEQEVSDPVLRQALTPRTAFGCKATVISSDYYASLQKDTVQFVPEAAAEIGVDCITSAGGRRFEVDTIVLATGFWFLGHVLDHVRRRDGRTVGEVQRGRPRAYKSVSVAGCPNLFLVGSGANGGTWHACSIPQLAGVYVREVLEYMERTGVRALEVDEAAEIAWKRRANAMLADTVLVSGACGTSYVDADGGVKAIFPGSLAQMAEALSEFDPGAHVVVAGDATGAPMSDGAR